MRKRLDREKIIEEWQCALSDKPKWVGFFDGACPDGNKREPGRTRFGAILYRSGKVGWQGYGNAGIGTVNTAEYNGLIELLEAAIDNGASDLLILGDSQLVILQMQGYYRVKNSELQKLHYTASELVLRIERVRFAWIPREQNAVADKLSKIKDRYES